MQKAIGYIRVSTQGQADEGVSLEAQRAKIRAWCELNDAELVAVFEDAGLSGASMKGREGLDAALKATGKGMALVCYSISRLARSTRDMLHISEQLDKKGADLVSLTEKIDTTTAAGRMVFKMLAVLADFGKALEGKVIIDITNPVAPDLSGLVTPHGSSGAQEIGLAFFAAAAAMATLCSSPPLRLESL